MAKDFIIDLDGDGLLDIVRVYNRKKGRKKTKVANVKFGTSKMKRKKKKREKGGKKKSAKKTTSKKKSKKKAKKTNSLNTKKLRWWENPKEVFEKDIQSDYVSFEKIGNLWMMYIHTPNPRDREWGWRSGETYPTSRTTLKRFLKYANKKGLYIYFKKDDGTPQITISKREMGWWIGKRVVKWWEENGKLKFKWKK